MNIGILKEARNDPRVTMVPSVAKKISQHGFNIYIEHGAGVRSNFKDSHYENVFVTSRDEVFKNSSILLSFGLPDDKELESLTTSKALIGMYGNTNSEKLQKSLENCKARVQSLDLIPRSSLAQKMDMLSALSSISGYRAVILAASRIPRYFPMLTTSAGTVKPAKVLVLGAGVAGLQAIATAKRLGAIVEVFDVRPSVKDQVESLGGVFIEVLPETNVEDKNGYAQEQSKSFLDKQFKEVNQRAERADVIICTAQIRGKKAPTLISKETVSKMRSGSVIVDLAAGTGGNCETTKKDEIVLFDGVQIIGYSDLSYDQAEDASTLASNILYEYLKIFTKENRSQQEEEIIIKTSLKK